MKRLLVCCGLVAMLAFPAASSASKHHFEGTVAGGGTVHFDLVKKNGKRKVTNFNWDDIPMTCDQGNTTDGGIMFTMKVKDGHFQGKGFDQQATAKVSGDFTHHYTKEAGTIRVFGNFPTPGLTGCDTGVTDHTASA
jgi:hypothetical protein